MSLMDRGKAHDGDNGKKPRKPVTAWSLVHARGFIHTNWVLGVGGEAWPGMYPCLLFNTRREAREALRRIVADASNGPDSPYDLPFVPRVVKVHVLAAA